MSACRLDHSAATPIGYFLISQQSTSAHYSIDSNVINLQEQAIDSTCIGCDIMSSDASTGEST